MFGRKAKIRKAVKKAFARVEREEDLADHAPIEALPGELQPQAYYALATWLFDDERFAAARHTIDRALVLVPDEVDLHKLAAAVDRELGAIDGAIAAQQRVVAAARHQTAPATALAELLISAERIEEAIALLRPLADANDRELNTVLAEALFVHGDSVEALAILDTVCARYESQLREPWSTPDRQGLISRAQHASRLRKDVYAELHGHEATIELAAVAGNLDARAGVNYRLLGQRLAAQSERVAEVLELEDPDATELRGRGSQNASGLALVGSAQLRRGELGAARKSFERACELDGRCFAAFFGLGAVLGHDKHGLHRRAAALDVRGIVPPALAQVVPDWPALTEVERHVVWASAQPFAAFLPVFVERAVTMRILPIDVRATDVHLFEHVAGRRARDDHRSYDAISGVATPRGAIAKIEELLQVAGDHGWTFAHEFAHLVYFHMTEQRAKPFEALFEKAKVVRYANTAYALKNDDELFAVSYTDFLRQRYRLSGVPIADDAGIQEALMRYFSE
ncbi:MAG TPA: tetratricopeptide repeat protein, partial [Kofleriaceae bacterium]